MTNKIHLRADGSIDQTIVDLGATFEAETISGGGFTFSTSFVELDTESAAASDDLDTIANGGTGKALWIKSTDAGRDIVFKHDTGNILTWSGADETLDDPNQLAWLIYNGSYWILMVIGGAAP